jgi:hypothetical protein
MLQLVRMEFSPELIAKLRSVRYYGGLPIDARTITDKIAFSGGPGTTVPAQGAESKPYRTGD